MQPADWEMVAFAIETGLRCSEQFRLRREQIDMENRVLTLPMPKRGRTRRVPLSEGAHSLLASWDFIMRSPWVFPGVKNPLKPMDSRAFEPALRRAGIVGVKWHALRHTAASRRALAGVDLYSIKDLGASEYSHDAMRRASHPTAFCEIRPIEEGSIRTAWNLRL